MPGPEHSESRNNSIWKRLKLWAAESIATQKAGLMNSLTRLFVGDTFREPQYRAWINIEFQLCA